MTGFNMPPGCNVSDIPGNRPSDLAEEAAYESIYEMLDGLSLSDDQMEALADAIFAKIGESWQDGYRQGMADGEMAQAITQK